MADSPIRFNVEMDEASLRELQAKFAAISSELERNWARASEEVAHEIVEVEGLKQYPINTAGAPQPFKSDKSRRYFFAALRRGEIEVPYRRGQSPGSETYAKRWYVEVSGLTATIGNNASYARYLSHETEQSGYMAARGWRKLKEVAEEKLPDIIKIYEGWTGRAMKNLGISSEE